MCQCLSVGCEPLGLLMIIVLTVVPCGIRTTDLHLRPRSHRVRPVDFTAKKCVASDSFVISDGVHSVSKTCDGWTDKRRVYSNRWVYDFDVLYFMFT